MKAILAEVGDEIPVQLGGGIRDLDTIERYLDDGLSYIIIGTAAVKNPGFMRDACSAFGGHIIVGLDAKDGKVATDGWSKLTGHEVADLAKKFEDYGVEGIIYTDIGRDGMLTGVNIEATVKLAQELTIPVFASGGLSTLADIEKLCAVEDVGIEGVICGRAIYSGELDFADGAGARRRARRAPDTSASRAARRAARLAAMLAKRIIPCLDVTAGRVVKGVNFVELRDAGDPVEIAARYNEQGADELTFLDITATSDGARPDPARSSRRSRRRSSFRSRSAAACARVADVRRLLNAGADKVSFNSAAVATPRGDRATRRRSTARSASSSRSTRSSAPSEPAGWDVYTHGGRRNTGLDVVEWARRMAELGAGEILLTSMDRDGTRIGFDLALTRAVADAVDVPVIASGGVGALEHLSEGIRIGGADAVLAASIFHFGEFSVRDAKALLARDGIPVRP